MAAFLHRRPRVLATAFGLLASTAKQKLLDYRDHLAQRVAHRRQAGLTCRTSDAET